MKRVICLLISTVLLLSCLSAMAETAEPDAATHTIEKKNVPLFIEATLSPVPVSRCTFWTVWKTFPMWT